jgi:AcrR family transcriptional regulator
VKPASRPYSSPVREAAAAAKRQQVLAAAARLLREEAGLTGFSLEAVAKAAGVIRATVYNQFGSRRGLLEAVFDDIALRGGLDRLGQAMAVADAEQAMDQVIQIFCEFWASDPAIGRLHEAVAVDAEFAQALGERNERRRKLFGVLMGRLLAGDASARRRRDAVDLLYAQTSYAMYKMLQSGRSASAVYALVRASCHATVRDCRGAAD